MICNKERAILHDLKKTGSFAVLHFAVGFGVAYLISGSLPVAFGMALIEPAVNTLVFFLHERAWKRAGQGGEAADRSPRDAAHRTFLNQRRLSLQG